jgi:TetR/AcrR family tetracycline transcriptional repressor
MSHRRSDVVEHALAVLDRFGLADLSMRRLATDLGVQPSALYWHFDNKQALLAAVADEVLRRGERPVPDGRWDERVTSEAHALRDAMLAYRDGAELVATTQAFGLGEIDLVERLEAMIGPGGVSRVAATTVLHFVLGHVTDEQTHLQAGSDGAIDGDPLVMDTDTFATGLGIVVAGISAYQLA